MRRQHALMLTCLFMLVACDQNKADQDAEKNARTIDRAAVVRGETVYRTYCATCHGIDGQGDENWRQRQPDGKWPPPPLNGTGHAWHHPKKWLVQMIQNGSVGKGGNMPGWKQKLSEQQIEDVIAWFQSKWPDEIYEAWARNNAN